MKKKPTPFLDFYNECASKGYVPNQVFGTPYEDKLYRGNVSLFLFSPSTEEEQNVVREEWRINKNKFTLMRQFAILFCAAMNNEL